MRLNYKETEQKKKHTHRTMNIKRNRNGKNKEKTNDAYVFQKKKNMCFI